MELVEGKLTLSVEDLQRGFADMPENVTVRRMMSAYAVLMILAGLGGGLMEVTLVLRGLWIALGVALIVYAQRLSRSAAKKLIATMKDGERDVSYRFDAQGVRVETAVSDLSLRYGALRRQLEVSTAFLLYTQERIAQVVPKRAFDAAQLEQIRKWLDAAVPLAPRPKRRARLFLIWALLILAFLFIWPLLAGPH